MKRKHAPSLAPEGPPQKAPCPAPAMVDSGLRLSAIRDLGPDANHGCVTLAQILSMDADLVQMFQFNYLLDLDWFLSQMPPALRANCKTSFVTGDARFMQQTRPANVSFILAPLPIPFGTHHTKMMILFYQTGAARLVVHTANLIEADWRNKTQACWISPLLSAKPSGSPHDACQFEQDLFRYLKSYHEPKFDRLLSRLARLDFSQCRAILICSTPGYFPKSDIPFWGHPKLRSELEKIPLACPEDEPQDVVMQFSSIGSLGQSPESWLTSELMDSFRACATPARAPILKLIYPTVSNVQHNLDGWSGGGSLPFSQKTWEKQMWMKPLMHQWNATQSKRNGAVPHVKTYCRISQTSETLSWLLVTSSNLSKAAWGVLQKGGSQLMVRSYELGILIHPGLFRLSRDQRVVMCTRTPDVLVHLPEMKRVDEMMLMLDPSRCATLVLPIWLPFDYPLTRYQAADEPFRVDARYPGLVDRNGQEKQ
ncbi:MAG: hypothetical protein SGCHY_004917 [Lobulomycetales sp.]